MFPLDLLVEKCKIVDLTNVPFIQSECELGSQDQVFHSPLSDLTFVLQAHEASLLALGA